MGVQGLTSLLEGGGTPSIVSFKDGEANARQDNILLIDASAVHCYLVEKLGDVNDWRSTDFHGKLYFDACRFLGGLQRSGLHCVLILDSSATPGHELCYIERRQRIVTSASLMSPTAEPVMLQAWRDLGLEVVRSLNSADQLLLAWALKHRRSLFAVMTTDSDFYVFGLPRIVHPQDVVVDAHCVSLHVWPTESLWRAWHIKAAGSGASFMPPLLQRAQIAAVLGNDANKSLRRRLEQRREGATANTRVPLVSPTVAARLVAQRAPESLNLAFFREPPISLRGFTLADVTALNSVVQSYMDEYAAAQDGSALRKLTMSAETLPWLPHPVAQRLAEGAPATYSLVATACRGLGGPTVPPPFWRPLQELRRALAQRLLGDRAPGAVYEYNPNSNTLHLLLGRAGESDAAEQLAAQHVDWFRPEVHLPNVKVVGSVGERGQAEANGEVPQRQVSLAETLVAVQRSEPELPPTLAMSYALSLHCVDPDESAWDPQHVREVLLPGVPLRHGAAPAAVLAGQEEEAREQAGVAVVDVGSGLNDEDWKDIDDKDVVAKVRSSAGFNLLKRIQPWSVAAAGERQAAGAVAGNRLFALAREALVAGPGSPQWAEAQRTWSSARTAARQQALSQLWSSANRWLTGSGGPMRHRHQQELLDLVDEHLARQERRAMHIILSTPTGSGKTFTAVMMQLHVLKGRVTTRWTGGGGGGGGGCSGEQRSGHPDAVLVYSVPTKQVLKRVGQECEANGVVYWTAACAGDKYEVRRPYSIRTQRGGKSTGAGTMRQQLEECEQRGSRLDDIGGGKPDVIIADIHATAALVRAAREAPPDAFYHSSKLILYLDEPNMGLHLDPQLRQVVRSIMASAPLTTVLASATLPAWDCLPGWWKGSGASAATHVVITQEPYELPQCRLAIFDDMSGQLVPVSPLELFKDARQLLATLESSPRGRVLLLRHFTAEQANEMLGLSADPPAAGAGEEGGEVEDDAWKLLDQDIQGLRSELLEPELMRLAGQPERFNQLREAWRGKPRAVEGLADVLSKEAVTLVATLEPRRMALQLAGKTSDSDERWTAEARAVRAKVRAAVAEKRAADKARERAAKRGDADSGGRAGIRDDGLSGAGRVMLRPGLMVMADEADDVVDDDTLVMLSKGFAYTSSREVEPLVKRLYQQALLYIPERPGARPPLHTLVVDYSAVYGTDCPSVDTIVLCPDLAAVLSWEDHQQFLGRLRRDGTAVYPSMNMLQRAVQGGGGVRRGAVGAQWREREEQREVGQRQAVEAVLAKYVAPTAQPLANGSSSGASNTGDNTAAAVREFRVLVRTGSFTRADVAAHVLAAALRDLVAPAPPLAGDEAAAAEAAAVSGGLTDTQLLSAAIRRLRQWGSLRPFGVLQALRLDRPAEQRRVLGALQTLCLGSEAGGGASALAATRRFLPCAARLLQVLGEEEILEEEALAGWCRDAEASGPAADKAAMVFRKAVATVRDWLEESEEEEAD